MGESSKKEAPLVDYSADTKNLIKAMNHLKTFYLVGWPQIARYCGVHPRTVKRWHYQQCKLPFHKSHTSQQGRVVIAKWLVDKWLECIG